MLGITIVYEFDGDETAWEAAISGFISAIDADEELGGRFNYRVHKAREGKRRIHWGWWDKPETVQLLQSRDYFKQFAATLKELAGDTLETTPVQFHAGTAGH